MTRATSMLDLLPQNLPQLQARVAQLGWIPPDAKLLNPRPAGEGNMNRTLLVDCSRTHSSAALRSIVLKQAVPFVAKYPDIAAPIERGAAEAAFYHAIQSHDPLTGHMPRLIGTDPQNHLLAFEYLSGTSDLSSAYSNPVAARALPTQMPNLLNWLSNLHAVQAPQKLKNICMRELNHTHIFDLPLQPDNGLELGELTSLAVEFACDSPLKDAAHRLGQIYLGKQSHRSTPALLHGDFYPGSWLGCVKNKGNEKSHNPAWVIDPEFAFVGAAEFDVGVCLAHLQFAGLTRAEAMTTLSDYSAPDGFETSLAEGFAGIELIRRLLGVAQLPLAADTTLQQKADWLHTGRELVIASNE